MAETGKQAAILLDTKGPEIRTIKLEGGNDVSLVAGQTFTFTTDQTVIGNKDRVAVTYAGFASDLRVGNRILVDDGLIGLDVIEITEREGSSGPMIITKTETVYTNQLGQKLLRIVHTEIAR